MGRGYRAQGRAQSRRTLYPLALLAMTGLLISATLPAVAQAPDRGRTDAPAAVELPPGVPNIPGARDRSGGVIISARNVQQYEDVLLAPVAHWVRGGKIAIRAVRQLDTIWELTPDWQASSGKNSFLYDLDETFTPVVRGEDVPTLGLPYGDATAIARESDPVRKAYKILWNSQVAEGIVHDVLYRLDLGWMGSQSVSRRANALYFRSTDILPPPQKTPEPGASGAASASPSPSGSPGPNGASAAPLGVTAAELAKGAAATPTPSPSPSAEPPQLIPTALPPDLFRRDLFYFVSPPVVAGLAQVAWRFRGPAPDLNWLHSPVIGQTRKLLPANRSDFLLAGSLTFDDLFVWATKPQQVFAKLAAEKVILVPFSALTYYKLDAREVMPAAQALVRDKGPAGAKPEYAVTATGFHQRSDGSPAMVLWNHETRQYPQLAPWTPTTIVFVPRRVYILELSPRDPYYLTGKEVLVIDQESFLPVYRIVYDRIGDYLKTVVGGWGLGRSNDGRVAFPFSTFVLSVDRNEQAVTTVTTDQVQSFLGKGGRTAQRLRQLFIPGEHQASGAKSATPEESEESEESEEEEDEEEDAGTESEDDEAADGEAGSADDEADSADGGADSEAGAEEDEAADEEVSPAALPLPAGKAALPPRSKVSPPRAPSALPPAKAPAPRRAPPADDDAGGF